MNDMKKRLPKIFIGSSAESLKIAYAIQESLDSDALCKVWTQGIFELSGNTLDNLLKAAQDCDYSIFVFQPDDISQIRNEQFRIVRDNVIFELGLFVGRQGKNNVFFLIPKNTDKFHLPTDLLGIMPGNFEPPENDNNLIAALGPFCNKVRRILQKSWGAGIKEVEESPSEVSDEISEGKIVEQNKKLRTQTTEIIEHGISIDEFGNYIISIAPTVLFSYRISKSFPGIRGLHWFKNPKEAVDRLELLLKKPLDFEESIGHGTTTDPIWWFRGFGNLDIHKFKRLNDTRCLLNVQELEIDKIAVFQSNAYYLSFVYVETKADQPIGVNEINDEYLEGMIKTFGYAYEEFGLYDGVPITRSCYDDGASVIDGKVIDTSGSELIVRYLSKYNFLITSKFSPINSKVFDSTLNHILNDILKGNNKLEELIEKIVILPRHRNDD